MQVFEKLPLTSNTRKPRWLKMKMPGAGGFAHVSAVLGRRGLHTVCDEARCPNKGECWADGTATIMIAGDACTRACAFCGVRTTGAPEPLDATEPTRVAAGVSELGLKYVVLTSVDRDDLPDGGAAHFAGVIREIKKTCAGVRVEALVPDFGAREDCIRLVLEAGLDVYAHNIETVERLQGVVRDPRASFACSLRALQTASGISGGRAQQACAVKSGLMVGFGETYDEIRAALRSLHASGAGIVTVGQYLQPAPECLVVKKYYEPAEFELIRQWALEAGIERVFSGPLVRSSYRAAHS